MMQKFEKVLDLAIEALELYLGRGAAAKEAVAGQPVKEKATRAKKAAIPPPAETESPFGAVGGQPAAAAAAASKLSAEEALEAGRRGQEVMGLFIRRYLKASPTGLERAKKIINDTLGLPRVPATAWKLEDFTPEDWLKLTPKFEAELDKAGA